MAICRSSGTSEFRQIGQMGAEFGQGIFGWMGRETFTHFRLNSSYTRNGESSPSSPRLGCLSQIEFVPTKKIGVAFADRPRFDHPLLAGSDRSPPARAPELKVGMATQRPTPFVAQGPSSVVLV
jgi:hypothetical protein